MPRKASDVEKLHSLTLLIEDAAAKGEAEELATLLTARSDVLQALVSAPKFCERIAQAEILGLLLLERVQRRADRLDEIAEGFLKVVERADTTVGIDQKVAQRLVVFTDPGTNIGKCRLAALFAAAR